MAGLPDTNKPLVLQLKATALSKHLFGTKFDTIGRIAAEILVTLYIHPLIFLRLF